MKLFFENKVNEDLADYFQLLHDSDYNWNRHNCDYTEFYDELNTYLKPEESVDAEDEEGYPLDSNIDLITLFRRMPKDKQIDFIDRFDKMNESLKKMNEEVDYEDFLDDLQELGIKVGKLPCGLISASKLPGRGNLQAGLNVGSRGKMTADEYRQVAKEILTACDMVDEFNKKWK